MSVLNFLLSIAEGLAVLSLVVSGVMYMISGGNEKQTETAKRAIRYSIVGIVVVLLSLAIVKTVSGLFAS
jgi:type IV secretory pathway VirB2 component (pilin)